MEKIKKYQELSCEETVNCIGGSEASRLIGLGVAMALVGGYGGPLAMGIAAYNYFKD